MRDHPSFRLLVAGSVLVATAAIGCDRGPDSYVYFAPSGRADGLPVADASVVGIDTNRIGALVRPFLTDRFGEHTWT